LSVIKEKARNSDIELKQKNSFTLPIKSPNRRKKKKEGKSAMNNHSSKKKKKKDSFKEKTW